MNLNIIRKSMTNITPSKDQIERIEDVREYYKMIIEVLDINLKILENQILQL